MPKIPKYCKNGKRAFVTLNGSRIYLGDYDSPESQREYKRVIAEWLAHGSRPAVESTIKYPLVDLLLEYLRWAKSYYVREDNREAGSVSTTKAVIRLLTEYYGNLLAQDFGPRSLKTLVNVMIEADWSRNYINQSTARIKHIFKWGAAEELVDFSVFQRLQSVEGLRKGKTSARETDPVAPVSDDVIERTIAQLPSVIADMVRFQRLTGARPGEVCKIRPMDVDREGSVWEYVLLKHKTQHHGKHRSISIGPKAQAVLLPYLDRVADSYCFSPAESESNRRMQLTLHRLTPENQGNKVGSNAKPKPKRKPGPKYTTCSYRRAIQRACKRLEIPIWSPNQIRHTVATEIRKEFGLEATQVVLGHSNAKITQVYAESNQALAKSVISKVG